MLHMHQGDIDYIIPFPFDKRVWSNHYHVFICLDQTAYIEEKRPEASTTNEEEKNQEYRGDQSRYDSVMIIMGNGGDRHGRKQSKTKQNAGSPPQHAYNNIATREW